MIIFIFGFTYSLLLSIIYITYYRLYFNFTEIPKILKFVFGFIISICTLVLLLYALPSLYIFLVNGIFRPTDHFFLLADFFAFSLMGFFPGLLMLFPVMGWFEVKTYNNPIFQKRNNKALGIFTFILVFFPNLIISYPHIEFKEDKIYKLGYFYLYSEEINYKDYKKFTIHSSSRLSYSRTSTQRVTKELYFSLEDDREEKTKLFSSESPDDLLANKIANLWFFLESKGLKVEQEFLTKFPQWKQKLEQYKNENSVTGP